jgi:hypothetical protein
MTGIYAAPIIIRRLKLFRLRFRRLGIGALLAAMPASLGKAFSMALVDPYTSVRHKLPIIPDHDLEDRDPAW